jgi:hypothetical protein
VPGLAGYALALAATIAVEAPILAWCLRGGGRRQVLGVAVLANLASHPAATALIAIAGLDWLLVEALVVAFEAVAFRAGLDVSTGRAWAAALLANGATAAIALAWSGA